LVVEDSAVDAELLLRQLRGEGFDPQAERVDQAETFVAALGRADWDVVLCDFAMPGFSGPEALQLLQASGKDIPFIIVTGAIGEEAAVGIMKAGALDFVLKNRIARLGPAVRREVHDARMRQQQRLDAAARVESQQKLEIAHQQLRQLSGKILQLQEHERMLLSRGLHDDVGQSLTGLQLQLQAIRRRAANDTDGKALDESIQIVGQLLAQVRDLSLDLRPPQLDQLGLAAALRWYGERKVERLPELTLHFEAQDLPPLDADVETAAFRIVQEAMTNVLRHAVAHRVSIALENHEGGLKVLVQDDGRGFDVAAAQDRARRGASLGLLDIQERAAMAGGRVDIQSRPGCTRVVIQLPGAVS
jgi:signal transduction histidine kinase